MAYERHRWAPSTRTWFLHWQPLCLTDVTESMSELAHAAGGGAGPGKSSQVRCVFTFANACQSFVISLALVIV